MIKYYNFEVYTESEATGLVRTRTVRATISGQRNPSKMTIQLMAICLNVNPAWLAGLDVPKYLGKKASEPEEQMAPLDKELTELLPLLTEDQKRFLLAQIKVALKNE